MGATIPVMTAVIPNENDDVGTIHSSIYGVNTLGAFIGCILSGFWIVPSLGYEKSLLLFGAVNSVCAFIYIMNNLQGVVEERSEQLYVDSSFLSSEIYFYSFVIGLVSLAVEILWFRILGLTIGSSYIVFPIIVSIYVLAIGFGSILIKEYSISAMRKTILKTCVTLLIPFIVSPYLPIIFSNIRVAFASVELAFYLYHFTVYSILIVLLGPSIFYMGKLLPLLYALLKKDRKNFGHEVGFLYFSNTIGTFFGAVVFGYLIFHSVQLETIYKLLLILFVAVTCILGRRLFFKKDYSILLALILIISFFSYTRTHHIAGLFRTVKPVIGIHFKNIFDVVHRPKIETVYFKDDPNTTVSIVLNVRNVC
jgi:spermidine synthase